MIEEADARLTEWVADRLPGVSVTLEAPNNAESGEGVSVHLLELLNTPPARGHAAPPLQISLRYLVTTWGEDVLAVHRLLGHLVFAALEDPDLDVEFPPLPEWYWNALNASPRPFFVLRVPLRKPRAERTPTLVREPLVLTTAEMVSLEGAVVGPGGVPIADAFVELCDPQRFTRTDGWGRFEFAALPAEPRARRLRVRTKGREFPVTIEGPTAEPVVVRLELEG